MAKNTYVSKVSGVPAGHTAEDGTYTDSTVTRYITQVDLGSGKPYDIATHHKINFRNGSGDNRGVDWNGLEDITVVIPDVSDLIANPIDFVGTIGENGVITYNNGATAPKTGYLVFAAADYPEFEVKDGEKIAIEAGDMAVYDGNKWIVVSGENQVTILAGEGDATGNNLTTVSITGVAKHILDVEGKELAINIDYADVKSHIKGIKNTLNVDFTTGTNKVTVKNAYVGLTQGDVAPTTIGTTTSFANATALADGTVTFADTDKKKYYRDGDITSSNFNAGVFPVLSKNAAATLEVTGTVSSAKNFVTSVDGIKSATFVSAENGNDGAAGWVSEVTASTASPYLTGISTATSDEDADFSLVNNVSFDTSLSDFVTGFGTAVDAGASVTDADGKVITAATIGAVTISDATAASHDVITGISDGSDYLTSATLVSDDNSPFKRDVVSTVSVEGNVLKFTSTTAMAPVGVSTSASGFTYGRVNQANSTFKTRNIVKGGYKVTANDYKWNTSTAISVSASKTFVAISTTAATVSSDSVGSLDFIDAKAAVPANTYVIGATTGTLPSFTVPTATGVLAASVATTLSTTPVEFLAAASTTIDLPGAYSLVSSDTASTGYVKVGAAGDAVLVQNATVADVVTDVQVDNGTGFGTVVVAGTPTV